MLKEMGQVAVECLKHPTRSSYWIPYEERYLCPESQQKYPSVPLEQREAANEPPSLHKHFKLVFLAAFGGTIFFTVICIACHALTGGTPPAPLQRLIDTLITMAQVGFGATVGVLGGRVVQ